MALETSVELGTFDTWEETIAKVWGLFWQEHFEFISAPKEIEYQRGKRLTAKLDQQALLESPPEKTLQDIIFSFRQAFKKSKTLRLIMSIREGTKELIIVHD